MPLVQFNLNFVPGVQSLFQQLLFAARAYIWPSPAYSNPMAKNKRMKNKCATRVLTLVSLYHNFFCVLELETQFYDPLIAGTFSFYNPHLLLICSTNNRDLYLCKSKEEMKQKRKDKITIQNITAIVSFTRLFNKEF